MAGNCDVIHCAPPQMPARVYKENRYFLVDVHRSRRLLQKASHFKALKRKL